MDKIIFKTLILAISVVVLFTACSQKNIKKEEIPITTSSTVALDDFIKGRYALDMGRDSEAREFFNSALKKDSDFCCAYLFKAYSATSAADWKMNMDLAAKNKNNSSEGEQILVDMNFTFLDNNAGKRLELAKTLVDKYPKSIRALITLAGELSGMKDYAGARVTLKKAIEMDSDFSLAYRNLAFSYLFNEPKNYSEAENYMKKFVEHNPNEETAHIGLNDVYRAQGDLEKARHSYQKATEINPESPTAFSKKGHANTFLGNYEQARNDYKNAQKVATDNTRITIENFIVYTYLYSGDSNSALDANEEFISNIGNMGIAQDQLTGPKAGAYYNRYMIAMHNELYDVAKDALDNRKFFVKKQMEEVGSADWNKVVEANNNIFEGFLFAYEGNYKKAVLKADDYISLIADSNDPRKMEAFHGLMGLIDLMQDEFEEALENLKKADQEDIENKYYLGLAYEGLGNSEEAMKIFREVAEWNFNDIAYALIRNKAIDKLEG